jgi:YD repeat-containing protein
VTYNYDTAASNGLGRLVSVVSGIATTTYGEYDQMGRVTSSTQVTGRIWRSRACQIRRTLASLTPAAAAIKRVLQWVALAGFSWVVMRTLALT